MILSSNNPAEVYILDESDLLLDKYPLVWYKSTQSDSIKIRGLAAPFHGEKTYFMSATYDDLQKKMLKQTFLIKPQEILLFENLSSLITGVKKDDF